MLPELLHDIKCVSVCLQVYLLAMFLHNYIYICIFIYIYVHIYTYCIKCSEIYFFHFQSESYFCITQYNGALFLKFLMLTAVSISYTDTHDAVKCDVLQIEVTSYHGNQQFSVTGCRYLTILYYL
jgi:hypothetical protein